MDSLSPPPGYGKRYSNTRDSMNVTDITKFATENLTDYAVRFASILSRPHKQFATPSTEVTAAYAIGEGLPRNPAIQLDGKCWAFAILSVFIGATLYATMPNSNTWDFVAAVVVTLVCWTISSALCFAICRVFGGLATFSESTATCLQVLATVYVVCNAAAFLLSYLPWNEDGYGIFVAMISYPWIQFISLAFYVPICLLVVHQIVGRSRIRTIGAALFLIAGAAAFATLNFVMFLMKALAGSGGVNPT